MSLVWWRYLLHIRFLIRTTSTSTSALMIRRASSMSVTDWNTMHCRTTSKSSETLPLYTRASFSTDLSTLLRPPDTCHTTPDTTHHDTSSWHKTQVRDTRHKTHDPNSQTSVLSCCFISREERRLLRIWCQIHPTRGQDERVVSRLNQACYTWTKPTWSIPLMGRDEHVSCSSAHHRKGASCSLSHLLNFDIEDGHQHTRLRVESVEGDQLAPILL